MQGGQGQELWQNRVLALVLSCPGAKYGGFEMPSNREVQRIQDQLRRSHQGPAWHGPSLDEILQGVDAVAAIARPIPQAHSIWELVLHVAGWETAAVRGIEGRAAVLTEEENFPQVAESTAAAWHRALQTINSSHQRLQEAIGGLSDDDLRKTVRGSQTEYSIYGLLHGVIQHNLYHAGQMALLKKAVRL